MVRLLKPKSLGALSGVLSGLGGASAAAASVDPSATIALSLASAIFAAMGCGDGDGIDFRKAVKQTRKQLRKDLRDTELTVEQSRALDSDNDDLIGAVEACLPANAAGMNALLANARLNPETLADDLHNRLPEGSPFHSGEKAETFKATVTTTWTALRDTDRNTAIHAAFFDEFANVNAKLDQIMAMMQANDVAPGLPIETARNIVRAFGEKGGGLDPDSIARLLTQKADEFTSLEERLRQLSNGDPKIDTLRTEAATRLEEGDFDAAIEALERAEQLDAAAILEQEDTLRARKDSRAKTLGLKGDTEKLRLNYRAAAEAYAEAAKMVDPADDDAVWGWLYQEWYAFYLLGREYGDNSALEKSIDKAAAMTLRFPRDTHPSQWAISEGNRALALNVLGEREQGTERLNQAVDAFRAVIDHIASVGDQKRLTVQQNNLGNALVALGTRESGTARLEQAVFAYTEALRERVPLDWAITQNNLGNALRSLGARETGTARLDQAVFAYTEALKEWTRDRAPLDWAKIQNNLGTALQTLGARESGTARLEQAVAAYNEALTERTRERVPLDWAMTKNNLGNALASLGERESGTARLEQAIAAFTEAFEEWTRERVPLYWAYTHENIGLAETALAEKTNDVTYADAAIASIERSLEVFREGNIEYNIEKAERNLAIATALRDKLRGAS